VTPAPPVTPTFAEIPAETSAPKPTKQPHPIFSLPDEDDEDARPEESLCHFIERRIAEAREPFQPMWDEMLTGIKAGKWKTQKELAVEYHRPANWITQFKRVALSRKVMSLAEWKLCFSGWKGNRGGTRKQ
jgi:hypothetical protein